MTFISYAQNFEDVMLWRALKHVENGFYIDVGAAWPEEHSVTKAFYDRGWHGINVEPNPAFHIELCKLRARDKNLKLAVGEKEGLLTFSLVPNTGLSTLDETIAERHRAAGLFAERYEVEVSTLEVVWQLHVPEGQTVHFLKIDVEGFEEAVIRGNNWDLNRPWIIVVEATLPMSQVELHQQWESLLLMSRYELAYKDGLNRFYVAKERSELLDAFRYPPNVFDGYKLIAHQRSEIKAQHAEATAIQALSRIEAMYASTSWRITAPLRAATVFAKNFAPSRLRAYGRAVLIRIVQSVGRSPLLRRTALSLLNHFPRVKRHLARTVNSAPISTHNQRAVPAELVHLSSNSRRIYGDLKTEAIRNKGGN